MFKKTIFKPNYTGLALSGLFYVLLLFIFYKAPSWFVPQMSVDTHNKITEWFTDTLTLIETEASFSQVMVWLALVPVIVVRTVQIAISIPDHLFVEVNDNTEGEPYLLGYRERDLKWLL